MQGGEVLKGAGGSSQGGFGKRECDRAFPALSKGKHRNEEGLFFKSENKSFSVWGGNLLEALGFGFPLDLLRLFL